jgi:hypothetical protein
MLAKANAAMLQLTTMPTDNRRWTMEEERETNQVAEHQENGVLGNS